MNAVRQFLKQETLGEHLRVDKAISQLNLAHADGLRQFLCIQNIALHKINAAWDISGLVDIPALIKLTERDLSVLGGTLPNVVLRDVSYTEYLGPAYVLAGSHFGKRVLQRRWMGASDPLVREAGAFLGTDILDQSWHPVISLLTESPITARARIAAAARRTFNIYFSAIHESLPDDEHLLTDRDLEWSNGCW